VQVKSLGGKGRKGTGEGRNCTTLYSFFGRGGEYSSENSASTSRGLFLRKNIG